MFKFEESVWERVSFPELSLGQYDEERVWYHIEPKGRAWNIKKKRPFIVVKCTQKHVYLLLLTTLELNVYRCKLDRAYGIGTFLPEVLLKECKIKERRCRWMGERSRIFKRRLGKNECRIVVRISKKLLAKNSTLCGECKESVFDDQVRFIVEEELEGWKLRNSGSL